MKLTLVALAITLALGTAATSMLTSAAPTTMRLHCDMDGGGELNFAITGNTARENGGEMTPEMDRTVVETPIEFAIWVLLGGTEPHAIINRLTGRVRVWWWQKPAVGELPAWAGTCTLATAKF